MMIAFALVVSAGVAFASAAHLDAPRKSLWSVLGLLCAGLAAGAYLVARLP